MDIVIKDLSRSYKQVRALDAVSLTISPGVHGLLGPNGAGKTTLMRILAAVLYPESGSISWGGLCDWVRPAEVKGKVGYLPQQFGMYKCLTVEEALKNVALLKNIPQNQAAGQIALALARTNLSEYSKRRVGQLSGGMLRRLGIAQAVLGEPDLLILDEPSVGLDPAERINLRKLIRDYNNGQRVILLSSHIVGDIESLCDTVTIMNNGKVLLTGSLTDIRSAANGNVVETDMTEAEFRKLEDSHAIINFIHNKAGYHVRFLSGSPSAGTRVPPTLEDSYTFIIQKDVTSCGDF